MALSVKYTSVFSLVAGMVAIVYFAAKKPRINWKVLGWIAILVLLFSGVWGLKNWAYAGNPFYPYLQDWFAGRRMSPAGYHFMLLDQGRDSFVGWHWWDFPWKLFVSKPSLFAFVGPLPLALLPLIFLFFPIKGTARVLALALLILWLLGLSVTGIMKFHLPAIVLTYLLVGVLVSQKGEVWVKETTAVAILSALLCFPYLAGISGFYYSGGGVWSGRETRQDYLARVVRNPYENLCTFVDQNLPSDARLLIVGDARGYGYPRDFYTDTGYDYPFLFNLFRKDVDLSQVQREFRKMGFTHVVVNGPQGVTADSLFQAYPLSPAQWKNLDNFFRLGLDLLYSNDLQAVYRVRGNLRDKPDERVPDPVLNFSHSSTGNSPPRQYPDLARDGRRGP